MIGLDAVTGAGVPARVEVDLGASPGELLVRQRMRLAARLGGLSSQGWRRRTRCPLWDVADVVTHLCDATSWALGALTAAETGAPPTLEGFDPGRTPHEHVLAGRGQAPELLLARLREMSGTLADRLDTTDRPGAPSVHWVGGDNLYGHGLVGLHLLWDSWLHELDLDAALSADGIAPAAPCRMELDAIAAYGVFFAGLVVRPRLGPEAQVRVRAELDELGYDLRLGSIVQLRRAVGDPAPESLAIRGPAVKTVEALAGRGDIAEVAKGDAPAIVLMGGLGARMRAPIDHTPVG
jgi:uncharacterized protein (TIGR03083 family)